MTRYAPCLLLCALAASGQAVKPIKILDGGVEFYQRPDASAAGGLTGFWIEFKKIYLQWDAPRNPPFRKSVAFLVGVSDYQEKNGFKPLPGVEHDLDRMRDFLLTKGGFDEVYIARKSAATSYIVQTYMMDVFHDPRKIGVNDRLLFYYSGHGDVTSSKTPYMMFAGAVHDHFGGDQVLKVKSYEDWSDQILAKHALFIFDACKAGDAIDHKASLEDALSLNGSRLFVSAGTGDQNAWYGNGGSIFTDLFLRTLEQGLADPHSGLVTITQAVEEAKLLAAKLAQQPGFSPMSPDISRVDSIHQGTFVFLNPAATNPSLSPGTLTVLNLVAKSAVTEPDRDLASNLALEHWRYIKDKNNEQLFQEHIDRFPQSPFLTAAKLELERVKKTRPVTEASKLPFAELTEQANAGDVSAMAELGIRYLDGANGASKSPTDAKTWLERAAEQRHADAAYQLGRLLYYGAPGLAPDQKKGIDWIQKADSYGSGAAPNFLGYLYGAEGLQKDEKKAVELFERGAAREDSNAMAGLGFMYHAGRGGLKQDDTQAVIWYRRAADAGNPRGMANLGLQYIDGTGGLAQDDAKAASWFRKAADAGDAIGMRTLGYMYHAGRGGLPQDDAQAVSWFRKAADAGDADGMNNLGAQYEVGLGGLPKDPKQAVAWYRKAADGASLLGMYNLGRMYEEGWGGLRADKTQAASWYRKAADAGNSDAKQALKRLGY
jgi:TPR repeat protein